MNILLVILSLSLAADGIQSHQSLVLYQVDLSASEPCKYFGALHADTGKWLSFKPSQAFTAASCAYFTELRKRFPKFKNARSFDDDIEVARWSELTPDMPIFVYDK
jgi:hypothetical protein